MTAQSRQIYVNLPVNDLEKSVTFWRELGFEFDPRFTDENATCMIINDSAFVMLLVQGFFTNFTSKSVANTATHAEAILCLSADSREGVDQLVNKALAAGGTPSDFRMDEGPMYGWSFQDVDGHLWEVMYMDPAALQQG